jgi:hypothetical protein
MSQPKRVRGLRDEVDSWRGFADALRLEDKAVYTRMVDQIWPYASAIDAAQKPYPVEPFFLTLLLIQHRLIEWLQRQLEEVRRERDASRRLDL